MGNKQDKSKRDEMFNTAYLEREDFELIWHGYVYYSMRSTLVIKP